MARSRTPLRCIAFSALREARHVTPEELAEAAGLTAPRVRQIERGSPVPRPSSLAAVRKALGVTLEENELVELALEATLPEAPGPTGEAAAPFTPPPSERRRIRQAATRLAILRIRPLEAYVLRQRRKQRAERQRREVAARWPELGRLSQEELLRKVEEERAFPWWAVAERLCEESERLAAHRADRALARARLAVAVAERSAGSPAWKERLLGYCLAFVANALRVAGDLKGAEATFLRAWKRWLAGAPADQVVLAEWRLWDLEASLLRARRHLPQAMEHLDRALAQAPEPVHGRIRLNRAKVLEEQGEFEPAVSELRAAQPLVDRQGDPRLCYMARFNLARCLTLAGRFLQARELLSEVRRRVEAQRNELDLIRLLWLEASVAAGLGEREKAMAALAQVQRAFTGQRIAYDAALVSLELAVLYLEAGRLAEARVLAAGMCWIFDNLSIRREALASLRLFCEAARKEEATAELARQVLGELRQTGPAMERPRSAPNPPRPRSRP